MDSSNAEKAEYVRVCADLLSSNELYEPDISTVYLLALTNWGQENELTPAIKHFITVADALTDGEYTANVNAWAARQHH